MDYWQDYGHYFQVAHKASTNSYALELQISGYVRLTAFRATCDRIMKSTKGLDRHCLESQRIRWKDFLDDESWMRGSYVNGCLP